VVIVPGNHDVCWSTSREALEPVAPNGFPKDLRRSLAERDGRFRWSWDEQRLYRVTDEAAYRRRLGSYWDAVESFYRDVDLPLPIDRERGFHLYRIFDDRMLVAGFESTHRNDHLRYEAELSTGVVSRCAMHLRKLGGKPPLLAAVWHHSVHGPPNKEDYLNIEGIREMAGLGFQIGFHGHQHLAESTDLSVSIGGGATMCVVSAGSLCASWRDLPRGTDRQYNIVRFDPSLASGTLHIREMAEGNQFTGRTRGRFIDGSVPLAWSSRTSAAGKSVQPDEKRLRELTIEVEEASRRSRTTTATKELLGLRPAPGTYPRAVLLRALQVSQAWPEILETFWPPSGAEEAVATAEAAFRSGDLERMEAVLARDELPLTFREDFEARRDLLKIGKRA